MKFVTGLVAGIVLFFSGDHLLHRLNQDLSLNRDLQLDVYLPSDACEQAVGFSDQIIERLEHFLLLSNCYHSDSFKESSIKWRFEHLVPPAIHSNNAYNQGYELGGWLQSKGRRGEKWSQEKLKKFDFFKHDKSEYVVHTLHFLCAHPDFAWQLNKPNPVSSWEMSQYALLSKCQTGTGYEQQMGIPEEYYKDSLGNQLLDLTNDREATSQDLDSIIQTLID